MTSTIIRDSIGFSIYFSSFDYMNKLNIDMNKNIQTLLSGGFAGILSWIFYTHLILLKQEHKSKI